MESSLKLADWVRSAKVVKSILLNKIVIRIVSSSILVKINMRMPYRLIEERVALHIASIPKGTKDVE